MSRTTPVSCHFTMAGYFRCRQKRLAETSRDLKPQGLCGNRRVLLSGHGIRLEESIPVRNCLTIYVVHWHSFVVSKCNARLR